MHTSSKVLHLVVFCKRFFWTMEFCDHPLQWFSRPFGVAEPARLLFRNVPHCWISLIDLFFSLMMAYFTCTVISLGLKLKAELKLKVCTLMTCWLVTVWSGFNWAAALPTAFPVWTTLRLVVIMAFPIFFPRSLFCTELQRENKRFTNKGSRTSSLFSSPCLQSDTKGILPPFQERNHINVLLLNVAQTC